MGSKSGSAPGSLYQKRKRWYWKVRRPDTNEVVTVALKPKGQTKATESKMTARAIAKRLYRKWGGVAQNQVSKKFSGWLVKFQRENAYEFSQRVARRNAQIVTQFADFAHIEDVDEIGPDQVQAYLMGLDLAPATVHKHRNAIRKFCRFLMRNGILDTNPAGRDIVSVPRIYRRPPRFLTDDQLEKALGHIKKVAPDIHPQCIIAVHTGLRLSEIRALRHKDVLAGFLQIGSEDPNKTYQARLAPLPPEAQKAIPRGRGSIFPQWDSQEYVKRLREATEPLPVFGELEGRRTGNQWHLFRSTWAVNRAREGATVWQLMQWGGWKQPQTVMRYVNLAQAAG